MTDDPTPESQTPTEPASAIAPAAAAVTPITTVFPTWPFMVFYYPPPMYPMMAFPQLQVVVQPQAEPPLQVSPMQVVVSVQPQGIAPQLHVTPQLQPHVVVPQFHVTPMIQPQIVVPQLHITPLVQPQIVVPQLNVTPTVSIAPTVSITPTVSIAPTISVSLFGAPPAPQQVVTPPHLVFPPPMVHQVVTPPPHVPVFVPPVPQLNVAPPLIQPNVVVIFAPAAQQADSRTGAKDWRCRGDGPCTRSASR